MHLSKKRFGQHFLNSQTYLKAIVDAACVERGDYILEIGPGKGSLTRELLARGARVVAIEKDRDLLPFLRKSFAHEIKLGQLQLIQKDIRDWIPEDLPRKSYKLVANIPYYITGAILKNFLTMKRQPSSMTLLLQKEVAARIARSKKESVLSLSVKAYGVPLYVKTVPRGVFHPSPTVDSAILHIAHISRKSFKDRSEEDGFFDLVHAGFRGKRKQIGGVLAKKFGKKKVEAVFEKLLLPMQTRGEDIPLEIWLALNRALVNI